jgi:hypothetical protein
LTPCFRERFLDRRFSGLVLLEASEERAAISRKLGFYSEDPCLLDQLAQFIGTALKAEGAAIVVATESHRDSLLLRLPGIFEEIAVALRAEIREYDRG